MEKSNLLTPSEVTYIIVGSILGLNVLSLPASVTKIANNDGWIGVILGSIYPLYIIFCSFFIFKNKKNINIIQVGQKYLGKTIGNILGIIFSIQFLLNSILITARLGDMLRTYVIVFLKQNKLVFPIILVTIYAASKGIKALGEINQIIFFISLPLIFILAFSIKDGNILNIKPMFSSGFMNILKCGLKAADSFSGMEVILLIVPLMNDKNTIKKCFLKGTLIIIAIYLWFTFMCIYYLGPDICSKLRWPVLSVIENIHLHGLLNFKYIFMFLWINIIFKAISNHAFFLNYSLSSVFEKLNSKLVFIVTFIIMNIVVNLSSDTPIVKKFINKLSIIYVIFNIIYITIILCVVLLKKEDKNEKINTI
ncbi:spore gernimation protein [Clostridium niameyense]|uniref:Spore gernimation protein n=1 Tax=Clostridium niameyense TaxID=1622073 RepID=A0A6M0R9A2_9CLOT|nr:endospore germination permease [Clostridium niameyense]NEZ45798.1 spore gernimation protein [Clostridium niameyense]